MKISHLLTTIAISISLSSCQQADKTSSDSHADHDHSHADHDHSHADHDHSAHDHDDDSPKAPAGPNGGRIISHFEPKIEFLIQEDRFVKVTILDQENQPTKAGDHEITLKGGKRSSPFILKFELSGGAYTSLKALPAGDKMPGILKFDDQIAKFKLDLSDCPTCSYREYACVCGH